MDLETENRLAAMLMEEARKLRIQAEKEGVHVYLRQPQVRGRPNSRFLTATVLGVQQANRAAEVNEMWRVRKKELELDDRIKKKSKHVRSRSDEHHVDADWHYRYDEADRDAYGICTSSKREYEDHDRFEDDGLRDEDVEEFLHSRVKRGRGAIGSRMDEPGPYLPSDSKGKHIENTETRVVEEWEQRVLGPEKPPFVECHESEDYGAPAHDDSIIKKADSDSSKKKRHSKHRSKEHKSHDKRRKDKKSRSKHRHRQS